VPDVTISLFAILFVLLPIPALAQNAANSPAAMPLVFERNRGQAPADYLFLARRGAMETLFLSDGLDLVVPGGPLASRLRLRWLGVEAGSVTAEDILPGQSNYLLGSDATRWLHNIPQYGSLRYKRSIPQPI
jgi:hypothetical protein